MYASAVKSSDKSARRCTVHACHVYPSGVSTIFLFCAAAFAVEAASDTTQGQYCSALECKLCRVRFAEGYDDLNCSRTFSTPSWFTARWLPSPLQVELLDGLPEINKACQRLRESRRKWNRVCDKMGVRLLRELGWGARVPWWPESDVSWPEAESRTER